MLNPIHCVLQNLIIICTCNMSTYFCIISKQVYICISIHVASCIEDFKRKKKTSRALLYFARFDSLVYVARSQEKSRSLSLTRSGCFLLASARSRFRFVVWSTSGHSLSLLACFQNIPKISTHWVHKNFSRWNVRDDFSIWSTLCSV